ncbi:tetratricopeptide repeat protein [Flavobacterium sp. ARAG 55.4]|uniref:Tetratricopeptide repeat-containing protein n=1 Tax=Flavobacterium plantiphilum TaxID=3163297 RepID=A0ABW8XVL7_9FLAO
MFGNIFHNYQFLLKTAKFSLMVVSILNSFQISSQIRTVYSTIETKNVLYYKVEEIVKMTFGGTTTRYTVSDLSLINKVDLGPDNIRIITPVYKDKSYKRRYYIETRNMSSVSDKNREPTSLLEISIESRNIEISNNAEIDQESLALVIGKIAKIETVPVKTETKAENRDFILINVADVYERVLEKGYKSAFMVKKVADYYYFKDQMDKAVKWYEELFALSSDLEAMYYYRFGNALLKTGKTERGNAMVEKFNQLVE